MLYTVQMRLPQGWFTEDILVEQKVTLIKIF